MLVANENIPEWELQFWQPNPTGAEVNHYTVKLTNASIASIEFRLPNNKDPQLMKLAEYEEVAFTYQRIQWTWNEGGITATDEAGSLL
jgi:type VI secretion system secreted protein Hcp